ERGLQVLFESAGFKYRIDPSTLKELRSTQLSINVTEAPFRAILDSICRAGRITYREVDGVFVIMSLEDRVQQFPAGQGRILGAMPISGLPPNDPRTKKINLNLKDVGMTDALRALFDQVQTDYMFPVNPESETKINLTMGNVPFEAALLSILWSTDP